MRRLLVLLLLLTAPIALRAQTEVSSGPVNPSHCNINKGQLFWNTTTQQMLTCGPTNNNWIAFSVPGVLVSSGLAANRPVSCNPGDLYVDTDDTLIFRCGPANTWTAVGGANPSPPTNALQKNNGSGGLAASVNTDDGTNLNIDENMRTKGPNPWIDVTRYGARIVDLNLSMVTGSITGSINSGSPTLTLSSAGNFQNGDGIEVDNAGTTHTLTTPAGVTVTPSLAEAGTGTGFVVNGPTGATAYQYQVIARTKQGGVTAASTVATTATGAASLGAVSVNLTSCSRTNDVVTCITSSPHGLPTGCTFSGVITSGCPEVYIAGASDPSYNGWWQLTSAVDNTHFTWVSNFDAREGAPASATGGTVQWFSCNHVTWTVVPNAFIYYIYGRTAGAMNLIGTSYPQVLNPVHGGNYWDDFGATMEASQTFPSFIPTSPPGTPTSNNLVTTISSGAGTTTLTLAANASTTVAAKPSKFDDAPAIIAAVTAATSGVQQQQGGAVLFPVDPTQSPNARGIVTNSYVDLSSFPTVNILQQGIIRTFDTWQLMPGVQWYGDRPAPSQGVLFSFDFNGKPEFSTLANPSIFFDTVGGFGNLNSTNLHGVTYLNTGTNGAVVLYAVGNFSANFTDSEWISSTSGNDYMGIPAVIDGGAFTWYHNVNFGGGRNGSVNATSHTPSWLCYQCGAATMRNVFSSRAGLFFEASYPTGSGALKVDYSYQQGSEMPFITIGDGVTLNIDHYSADTTNNGAVSSMCMATCNIDAVTYGLYETPTPGSSSLIRGNAALINGRRIPMSGVSGLSYVNNSSGTSYGTFNDYNVGGFTAGKIETFSTHVAVGANDQLFINTVPGPAPTCAVGAGGSFPVGSFTFKAVPLWGSRGAGNPSNFSNVCTTSGGNQSVTITWPPFPGNPVAYDLYGCTTSGTNCTSLTCATPAISASVALTFTQSTPSCGVALSASYTPSGGSTAIAPGTNGVVAPGFMMYANDPVYDTFNRADGAVGTNWTNLGTGALNVLTNQLKGNTGGDNSAIYSAISFPYLMGQFAQATNTVIGAGAGSQGGVAILNTTTGGYSCFETTTNLFIYSMNANGTLGGQQALQGITGVSGDVIRLEISPFSNPSIKCYLNGVLTLSAGTAATVFTPGSPGIYMGSTTARLDNWSGGYIHPFTQIDTENDWIRPQHFTGPVTFGSTVPIAGALAKGIYLDSSDTGTTLSISNTPSATGNANITATTMVATTSAEHTYLFQWTVSLVTPGTSCTGNTTVEVDAIYTDPNGAGSQTQNLGVITIAASGNGTAGMVGTGVDNIRAKTGTAVQYQTSNFTAGTGCSPAPTYKIYPVLSQVN